MIALRLKRNWICHLHFIFKVLLFVLGSAVNGIICIYDDDKNLTVGLWNPATKEIKVIPSCVADLSPRVLALPHLHGFGYDYVRDDYKVIQRVS